MVQSAVAAVYYRRNLLNSQAGGHRPPLQQPRRNMNRRSFLRGGAVLPLAPPASSHRAGESAVPNNAAHPFGEPSSASAGILPGIPESKDLAGDRLVYNYSDSFGPPTAQNEGGFCQATKSVSGVAAILIPPFSCCGSPSIPTPGGDISPGNLITCEVFLNGRLLSSYPPPEGRLTYRLYPDRAPR